MFEQLFRVWRLKSLYKMSETVFFVYYTESSHLPPFITEVFQNDPLKNAFATRIGSLLEIIQ